MRRLLLNLLTALSLLLCAAVVALWVRSWQMQDIVCMDSATETPAGLERSRWIVHCLRGLLFVQHDFVEHRVPSTRIKVPRWGRFTVPRDTFFSGMPDPNGPLLQRCGFTLSRETTDLGCLRITELTASAPQGSLLLLAGMLPVLRALRRFSHVRRTRRGLCPSCAYDLRATPGRCPECGHVPAVAGAYCRGRQSANAYLHDPRRQGRDGGG